MICYVFMLPNCKVVEAGLGNSGQWRMFFSSAILCLPVALATLNEPRTVSGSMMVSQECQNALVGPQTSDADLVATTVLSSNATNDVMAIWVLSSIVLARK